MNRIRGNSMVGMMVAVVIIMVLMVGTFYGSGMFKGEPTSSRADGKGTTVYGAAMYSAKDDVCRSNLYNVRASLKIAAMDNDDQYPSFIEDTRLGANFYECPIGKEKYRYDSSTGTVACPHPGHEKF